MSTYAPLSAQKKQELNLKQENLGDRIARIEEAGYLSKQSWTNVAATAAANVLASTTLTAAAQALTAADLAVSTMDVPRTLNVKVTLGGGTQLVGKTVTITGTNIDDDVISESFDVDVASTTVVAGVKAFKTVTAVSLPIRAQASDAIEIGYGVLVGFATFLYRNTVLFATCDGAYEATRPTVTFDADELEKNVISFNTAPNASRDYVVYFIEDRS